MWKFEKRFLNKDDIGVGPFKSKHCLKLWLILTTLCATSAILISATAPQLYLFLLISPILARLIALDLCYLVLPDIYTLPLLVIGLILPLIELTSITLQDSLFGVLGGAGSILLLTALLEKWKHKSVMGGGDIKMIAAAGAFLGLGMMPIFLWVSCALSFLLYPVLKKTNNVISFGPALIISFWVLLIHPQIIDKALSLFM